MAIVQYAEEEPCSNPLSWTEVGTVLASKVLLSFPKVNLISILAGTLALISVFLPWWGVDGSAFGFTASIQWSLWGEPYLGDNSSSATLAQAARVMGLLNILVMAVVLITAAFAFLGSFARTKEYVATGFVSSIAALVVYAGAVGYTLTSSCRGTSSCLSGPVGSTFVSGASVSWGFQAGFYTFLVGGILILFAVIFHQIFLQRSEVGIQSAVASGAKFCSNCGHQLQTSAKFCSNCAQAVPS